jgi:hypothetical protein
VSESLLRDLMLYLDAPDRLDLNTQAAMDGFLDGMAESHSITRAECEARARVTIAAQAENARAFASAASVLRGDGRPPTADVAEIRRQWRLSRVPLHDRAAAVARACGVTPKHVRVLRRKGLLDL